jgi:invasion protein IalB
MPTKLIVAALAALPLMAGAAQARAFHAQAPAIQGHQGEAPPWSFACMKDHGPSQCGEPMWIYGN